MPRRKSTAEPRHPTNVSIRSDLLAAARDAGVNLSATLERAPTDELAKAKRWREENREAIARCNEFVQERGVFGDRLRSF
jgi:antitoxin CcdA